MTAMPAQEFAARTFEEIAADMAVRRAVGIPYDTYRAVAEELRPLVEQVAQMAGEEPHQLVAAADYLAHLLEREPLRSKPTWEPQRVVFGLFLLGLTNALARAEAISTDERATLRPAYHREAGEAVRAALTDTFPSATEERDMDPSTAAPDDPDDDFSQL